MQGKGTGADAMTVEAPLELHRETVRPEWIDYNGHMNVAFYVLAFDHASDAFLDYIGLDEAHRRATGGSTFVVETHVTYQREMHEGDSMRFATQLLDYDAKRLRFIHHMYHADEGYLAATSEWLGLYVDLNSRKVAEMPAGVQARLAEIHAAHSALDTPAEAGRAIALKPRSAG